VVACYADIILPAPPVVNDNCGDPLTPTGPVEGTVPGCEGDITYTWTYADCEGNTQDYVHTVTIEYAPFAAISPTTDVIDCYANIVLPAPPVITDNCGVTLTPSGPVEGSVPSCEGDVTYTWTYADCEGNTQNYVHTVSIIYQPIGPITPTTDVVACYADIVLPAPPVVTDNCGANIIPTGPIEGTVPTCAGNVTYTWTYTDCSGNVELYVHTVTIDYLPIGPIAPTSDVEDCYANIVLPAPPSINDNCGTPIIPTGPIESGTAPCVGVITYTWTYTDCEGNAQDYVHSVTIDYQPIGPVAPTTAVID
jgi:hypothetical protein